MDVLIPNAVPDISLLSSDLTEVHLEGNGVWDKLIRTFKLHLQDEFNKDRLTGTAYATALATGISQLLGYASDYTLRKAKLGVEIQGLELNNQVIGLEKDKLAAEINRIITGNVVDIKQGYLVDAQICEVKARTNSINADVGMKLPVEVDNLTRQGLLITAQTTNTSAQTSNVRTNTATLQYKLDVDLPIGTKILGEEHNKIVAENLNIPKQGLLLDAQTDLVISQDDTVEYKLANHEPITTDIMKGEHSKILAENLNIPKQGLMLDAQKNLVVTQDSTAKYKLEHQEPIQTEILESENSKIIADTVLTTSQNSRVIADTTYVKSQDELLQYKLDVQEPIQTNILTGEHDKITADVLNIPKQGILLDAQAALVVTQEDTAKYKLETQEPITTDILTAEKGKLTAENLNIPKQGLLLDAQKGSVEAQASLTTAQKDTVSYKLLNHEPINTQVLEKEVIKLTEETKLIPKQGELIDAQIVKMLRDIDLALVNITLTEKELLLKDKQLDLLLKQIEGQDSQNALYDQKTVTERAQTDPTVIKPNSVIDFTNRMLKAQEEGFKRDAEQKATKLLVDTWSLRKNSDPDGNPENGINKLEDTNIGKAVSKMLAGIDIVV